VNVQKLVEKILERFEDIAKFKMLIECYGIDWVQAEWENKCIGKAEFSINELKFLEIILLVTEHEMLEIFFDGCEN
jgi:hypothetical protein